MSRLRSPWTETYRMLGVKLVGRRASYVKKVCGVDSRLERISLRVEAGRFRLQAFVLGKGAFAVYRRNLAGCYVSNEFPCFSRSIRLEPR